MRRPPMRPPRRAIIIGIAALIVLLIALGGGATFYTDLLWFREVGFTSVFWRQIVVKLGLGAFFGAIFAAVLLLNLWIVRRITSPRRLFTVSDAVLERYRSTLQPYVGWAVLGMALLFGLFAGSGATSRWRDWLLFRNAVDFGQVDPVFHKDLGFYVFRLPFLRFLFVWAFTSLVVITIIVAFAHYYMGGIRAAPRGERVAPEVRAHLSVLLGALVLLKAWGYRLDQFDLLLSPRGTVTGASYTDIHAQLPALKLLVIIAILVGVLFLVNVRVRASILPLAGIGLLALTSIFAGGVYPAVVQRLRVTPVERIRERLFIDRNIKATRTAFGIDDERVEVRSFPAREALTSAQVRRNQDTIQNIRLWSPDVLDDSYRQLQRIKQYYEFFDVDVDRYAIGPDRHQVMLAAREISQEGLSSAARTWVNTHLVYTHGFGVVASRVSGITGAGQPDFILKDIPPEGVDGFPTPSQPRVYFGQGEDAPFVVVNTAEEELDFPRGDSFERTRYRGKGGVPVGGFLRRVAFAWRFRDFNLLVSGALSSDSKIVFRRKIQDRVRQVAPFLKFDGDPYVVIAGGRLLWVVDAYTTTNMYPYAERISLGELTDQSLSGEANYIRNSVKATVDAYDGTITLYVWDGGDPIIQAWRKAFPAIFRPRSEMSADLLAHVRYPEDLFKVQTDRFTIYHIINPDDFYSKEDAWEVAKDPTSGSVQPTNVPPYYVLMRLPGERRLEFILMRPYTPNRRKNMLAWLAARSDAAGYGELISFVFPKQRVALGPEQVQARFNQDPIVSPQITLLCQRGSTCTFGNLLVIPIEESLLYVQPLYLESPATRLPELKRVIVLVGDRVRIAATLEDALGAVFGQAPITPGEPERPEQDVRALLLEAVRHFEASQEALRRADFAAYGREQEAMRRALERAEAGSRPSPAASPAASPSP